MSEPTAKPSMLATLLENRDAAFTAYKAFVDPIVAENRAFTDEETTERTTLKAEVDTFDARLEEVYNEKRTEKRLNKIRKFAGADGEGGADKTTVRTEPRVYGKGSPNSYFADFVRASGPFMGQPGHTDAVARLARYANEVAHDVRQGGDEADRALDMVRSAQRTGDGEAARSAEKELRARADRTENAEFRVGMDTGSTSGGSFVTPQYFVSDYAPYRQFDRVFADASNKQGLPDYGMTVYIPALNNPALIGSQSSQNTGIDEQDPTAGYLSNNLTTEAGQVTVSQQLLDRAGPNFAFDKMVFDQLDRAHSVAVDQYVITTALATAGSITATTSAAASANAPATSSLTGLGYVQQKVAQAKAATVDAAGVVLPATHCFMVPVRWENLSSSVDVNGRSLFTPDWAGVFASIAAGGDFNPIAEGNTGMKLSGLPVYEDGNIGYSNAPTNTEDYVIVAHMPEVWLFEGAAVPRVIPQTYAQNLSVLLQLYSYLTVIVRYPLAVQAVTGAAFTTPAWVA